MRRMPVHLVILLLSAVALYQGAPAAETATASDAESAVGRGRNARAGRVTQASASRSSSVRFRSTPQR